MTMRRTFVALAAAGAMLSTAALQVVAAPLPIANPSPDNSVQQVQYRHGYGHRHGYYGHHHGHYGGGAAALGGLAAGAIIGGAIANSQAQSNAAAYCAQRYRSYDPGSGTYLGHDGMRHACP